MAQPSPWSSLQELLQARAELPSDDQRHLIFYPLGGLSSPPRVVSYRSLYDEAQKNSLIVATLPGFTEGKPVLLHLDDHWDCLAWLWGILLANGLPVLSSPLSNIDEHRRSHLGNLAQLLEGPICIMRESSAPLFRDIQGLQIHTVESLLLLDPTTFTSTSISTTVGPIRHKSPAILMLTSGSTGNAKAVRLSHRQILASVAGKVSLRPPPQDTSFLNWINLDHVASLVESHVQALFLGLDQVHVHAADFLSTPLRFLGLLSRHRVSRTFAPNFFLSKLVAAASGDGASGEKQDWDLSSLKSLVSGGEANHVSTVAAVAVVLENYGAPNNVITPGFGMTETCAGAIYNLSCPERDAAVEGRTVASLGRCMPGIEMRIVQDNDGEWAPCQSGEAGHLQVRGDVVFDGYYRNAAATSDAFTEDGWFKTGDQAALDEDGNLCLTGRFKDVININGVKIVTADIQAAVDVALKDTCASRSVVFASRAPGAATEQVTVAYLTKDWPPEAEDMVEIGRLARQACIMVNSACARPVVFPVGPNSLTVLPTTTLGKISGAKMRKLFEAGLFDGDVEYHREEVKELIKRKAQESEQYHLNDFEAVLRDDIAETMDLPDSSILGPDESVFELGFSSMDVIRLKHRIETRLDISVPTILFLRHHSVRSLANALARITATAKHRAGSPSDSAIDMSDPFSFPEPNPDEEDNTYEPVVTLSRKGTATPLWLIHPGLGEVLVFVALSQHLAAQENRPIYALRARGFEPNQPHFASIPEAVDTYVAAIRSKQPSGPYLLAGYSYGSMLAYEIAKRLDNVQFLASIDLPPHIRHLPHLGWNIWFLTLAQFLGFISEAQFAAIADETTRDDVTYRQLSRAEAFARVMAVADQAKVREAGLTQDAIERWVSVAFGLQTIAAEYEPVGRAPCGIDVFHAEPLSIVCPSREEWVTERLSQWSDFCEGGEQGLRMHAVGGTHYTMLGPEHVGRFAEAFTGALAARGV